MTSKEALEKLLEMAIENGLWKSGLVEDIENIILRDLEVLEIIKTKNVDISLIKNCYGPLAYAVYNSHIDEEKNDELTKEEYDLLKEWLENDK